MESVQVDWVAVFIAAVLNMVIGFVWYSKWLFNDEMCAHKGQAKKGALPILWAFLISLLIAFFLAFFEGCLNVTTVSDGMFVGFCFWLGFVMTTQISPVIWYRSSLKVFFIHTGYKLLSFLVMGGIIGA